MDALDRLFGLALLAVALGPVVAGGWRLRSQLLPGWTGAEARVAESVIAVSLLLVALELVGMVGAFGRAGVVLGALAVGGLAWWGAGRLPRGADQAGRETPAPPSRYYGLFRLLAVGAVAALAATWTAWTIYAYRSGMETVDTLWYHLPVAARFVQTGSVLDLHYLDPDAATVFYPSNSPLLHAFALAVLREDMLSPLVNLGWLALALTAAWAIGKPYGRAPHCLVVAALVAATPAFVDTQPGGAYNDTMCLALALATVALLLRGQAWLPASAVAAMAAALAFGTKFTMIAPAGVLALGAIAAAPKGSRLRTTGVWAAAFLVLGGIWYVRNAIEVGNPLPSLSLGPLAPTELNQETYTVAEYLKDGRIWSDYFFTGLRQSLGFGWWALLGLSVAGAILAAARGGTIVLRVAGVVAILGAIAYLVTPQFLGLPGAPFFFTYNVRYAAVPLCLGLLLLPLAPIMRRHGAELALLIAAALILVAIQLDPAVWPTGLDVRPFSPPVRGTPALAGLAAGALVLVLGAMLVLRPRFLAEAWGGVRPGARALAAAVVVAGAAVIWLAMAGSYAERRYSNTGPFPTVYRWGQGLNDQRIGLAGFILQYPLYGREGANHVQYLTAPGERGAVRVISSCAVWRRTVNAGRYDWLVLSPGFGIQTSGQEEEWTRSSPAAQRVLEEPAPDDGPEGLAQVYRIRGKLDPKDCPA